LFTNKGGLGTNASGGLYYPNSSIILYANVTYNGEGMADILATYEVMNPHSHVMISSTARSDLEGIARMNFIIPSAPLEEVSGNWSAFAIISVAQKSVSDKLTFEVTEDPHLILLGDAHLDGKVDIRDAALLVLAWRAKIDDENYDPNCGFNKDDEVDIEGVAIMSIHRDQRL
jgi:hypothetical protein